MVDLVSNHWAVLSANPMTWILYTLVLISSTFALARLYFNDRFEVGRDRMKLANDEVSRLKDQRDFLTKKLLEHGESIERIQADLAKAPKIYRGNASPPADLGKDGDIYLQVLD